MPFGSDFTSGRTGALQFWRHYASSALMLELAAALALGSQPIRFTHLGATLALSLAVLVLTTFVVMRQHDRGLCEQCVSEIPLDLEKAAAKAKWRFWMAHEGCKPIFAVPYFAMLIGTNFLPGESGRLIWAMAQSTMVYLLMAANTHRKLQPWCPWCKGDGGGEDRVDVDPLLPRDRDRELV
jgi:hypothetical protein